MPESQAVASWKEKKGTKKGTTQKKKVMRFHYG